MAREMKYSGIEWIGQIPNSWGINKIKHNFSIVSGATPKSENADYWDGDILWITPADFKTQDKYVVRGKRNISQAGYDSCGTTLVPENSVIFSKRAPVGTVAIAKTALCTNQGCLSCIPKKKTSSLFYYYAMSIFTEQFELVSTGTTFKEIAATVFSDFYLPHPSIEEQQRIATFLDSECSRIDSVIEQTRASIEEYKKLKQAVITQAVTKGIRSNRPLKKSSIDSLDSIPESWKEIRNSFLFRENVRIPYEDSPSLSLSQADGLVLTDDMKERSLKTSSFDGWKRVEIGDLVLNRFKAHLGVFFAATVEGMVSFHYGVYAPVRIVNSKYYEYLFHSEIYRGIFSYKSNGMTVGLQNLSNQNFYDVKSLYPSIDEQNEIVQYIDSKAAEIDILIQKKDQLISELEAYKKALIFEYVTGKKEVPA